MLGMVVKGGKEMRLGYTTGSSATAAAKAAAAALLSGKPQEMVKIETPNGTNLLLEVVETAVGHGSVTCCVRKDAGDDPDVTNGILICACVEKTDAGISINGGKGIGRVTKPGLACKVGEAAINPVPHRMIEEGLREIARRFAYNGGFSVIISAPEGECIAQKTYNPLLGIVGGISILGTTGIVEPMSEAALVDTIKVEIDSRLAGGTTRLLVTPGNYGRDFAQNAFGLNLDIGVKCSNYIGETLDYAVYKGVKELLLIGHAGKLVKLAAGVMNTHSRVADCRAEAVAAHAALHGADSGQVKQLMECITTEEMGRLLVQWGLSQRVWHSLLSKMMEHIDRRTGGRCAVELIVFTNQGGILVQTSGAAALAENIRAETEEKRNDRHLVWRGGRAGGPGTTHCKSDRNAQGGGSRRRPRHRRRKNGLARGCKVYCGQGDSALPHADDKGQGTACEKPP